jgi:NAD+ diphosphatase
VERLVSRRSDAAWLAQRWADPVTRVLVVRDGQALVRMTEGSADLVFVPPDQAPPGERYLLGADPDLVAYFGLAAAGPDPGGPDPGGPAPGGLAPDLCWAGLREAGLLLCDRDASLLIQAVALANWHARSGYCPACGSATELAEAGHMRRCLAEGTEIFPRNDPAVIMLVTDADDRCLLARNVNWPARRVSVLAGFVESGESAEQAVVWEVLEEVGVAVRAVNYASSQPWPMPHSLMLGFRAEAASADLRPDGTEIAEAAWYTRDEFAAAVRNRELLIPPSVSISRWLIETWYGERLPSPVARG